MKRKRQAKNVQSLKKVASSCSSDTFHSKITTKFQTLFNGFVSELQSISEDKRPDVTLLFSPGYSVSNSSIDSSTVPSLENSCLNETTIALQNFIDSAKSKLPSLLSKGQEDQNSHRVNLLKSLRSSATTKTIRIDPLQIQISLKLQSLLCKALDSKKSNTKNGKSQSIASKGLISETDWQDLSLLLQDFTSSAKQKLSNSLAKNCNGYQVNVAAGQQDQNSTLHSSQPCDIALPSSVSHTVNKEFLKLSQKLNSSPEQVKSSKVGKENLHSVPQPPSMDSSSESGDGFDNPDSDRNSNEGGGIMLLHEAERAPEYLELELETDSDTDNPPFQTPVSESDEEVIVLGEKRPTYQEITLEEDDEGEVHESVIEKELQKPAQNEIEELLLNCPKCGKGFRVESLLKFHLRMHGTETPLPTASEQLSPKSSPRSEDDSSSSEKILNTNQSIRKEKENSLKCSPKLSFNKKSRRDKYRKRRSRDVSKCFL